MEQEEKFIENLRADGLLLSQIRGLLGNRRQTKCGLQRRELDAIYIRLHDVLTTRYSFITFEHPRLPEFWETAEEFCSATNIGTSDAIHLASAIGMGCNILATRDKDFRRIADDYIVAILPEEVEKGLSKLRLLD